MVVVQEVLQHGRMVIGHGAISHQGHGSIILAEMGFAVRGLMEAGIGEVII